MEKHNELFSGYLSDKRDQLFRICRTYTTNDEDARDLFQEVLLNMWKALPGFQGGSSISTWGYRICLNVCLRSRELLHKKESHFTRLESIHLNKETAKPYDMSTERKLSDLRHAIQQLSQPDKSIILLALENVAYREIAEVIGVTENYIAVRMKRIKEKLTKTLNPK